MYAGWPTTYETSSVKAIKALLSQSSQLVIMNEEDPLILHTEVYSQSDKLEFLIDGLEPY